LLEAAGLRPKKVDVRYENLAHGKRVNASQAQVLNKTAGAHRGAEMGVQQEPTPPAE
jgi:hypothetical protein